MQHDKTTAIETIRARLVDEMGACGDPKDCHRANGGCCALGEAIAEYEGDTGAE